MRIAAAAALLAALTASTALAQTPAAKPPKPAPAKAAKVPAQPPLAQLAAAGDAEAQYKLAQAFRDGKGAKRNADEAASWFALAAANGQAAAAAELAQMHEQGAGLKRDKAQAALWWFRAAALGDEAARGRFVALFLAGDTDDIGGPTGAAWVEAAAQGGDAAALLAVGQAYELGKGVPADPDKARQWYQQAAFGGDAEAKYRLGRMLLSAPGAWRLVYKDPEREAKNTERGTFHAVKAEAAALGGDDRVPDPVRPGMVEGEQWLREAARQGHAGAQYTLGMAFLGGMDLPFDLGEAVHWLSAAAFNGHGEALLQLADLAAKGQGFGAKDPIRAWVSYDLAVADGLKAAEEGRERVAKTMTQKQLARARQVAQDLRGN